MAACKASIWFCTATISECSGRSTFQLLHIVAFLQKCTQRRVKGCRRGQLHFFKAFIHWTKRGHWQPTTLHGCNNGCMHAYFPLSQYNVASKKHQRSSARFVTVHNLKMTKCCRSLLSDNDLHQLTYSPAFIMSSTFAGLSFLQRLFSLLC